MPIYLVVSETLYEKVPILDFGEGPLESYGIVDLVISKSREQARYLAWEKDKTFSSDIREIPNFRTRKLSSNYIGLKRIVSDWEGYQNFWEHPKAIELLYSLGRF